MVVDRPEWMPKSDSEGFAANPRFPAWTPEQPTNHPAGSGLKINEMRNRLQRGEHLHHPEDSDVISCYLRCGGPKPNRE